MTEDNGGTFSKLRCHQCNKYLSYFPIYTEPGVGSVCGRCQHSEIAIRNNLYEQAMSEAKFPCSFDTNGCIKRRLPKDVPQHETWCKYRTFPCPAAKSTNCEWQGMIEDLYAHYEKKHVVYILHNNSFEMDFVSSHDENSLMDVGSNLYIVNQIANSKDQSYFITVNYFGCNPECTDSFFKVTLKSPNRTKQHVVRCKLGNTVELKKSEIMRILEEPLSLVAEIEIVDGEEDDNTNGRDGEYSSPLNWEMLKEVECLVCFELMLPPIFQCVGGHSICRNCKSRLTKCGLCKNEYTSQRNYSLERLITHLTYPCKYENCYFSTAALEIEKHQDECIHKPFNCPLKEYVGCQANISKLKLVEHIRSAHDEYVQTNRVISYPVTKEVDSEHFFILLVGKKMFLVCFFLKRNKFSWHVQYLGFPEESKSYAFEIIVRDAFGSSCMYSFKGICKPSTLIEVLEATPYVCLQAHQIAHLIIDKILFEINISKVLTV